MRPDAICKEVIILDIATRGKGIKYSPIRRITQVFEKDGIFIAEHDPYEGETFIITDLIHFGQWLKEQKNQVVNDATVIRWLDSIYEKK